MMAFRLQIPEERVISSMGHVLLVVLAVAFPASAFCEGAPRSKPQSRYVELDLELIAGAFSSPLYLISPPMTWNACSSSSRRGPCKHTTVLSKPFLDIHDRVSFYGERRLLSIAFHPQFANNRRLFVVYAVDFVPWGNKTVAQEPTEPAPPVTSTRWRGALSFLAFVIL
jgi:hypothetical protein